jgi:hypothetical protein
MNSEKTVVRKDKKMNSKNQKGMIHRNYHLLQEAKMGRMNHLPVRLKIAIVQICKSLIKW